MTKILGQLNHEDGTSSIAIADNEGQHENGGNFKRVVSFPEPGGTYAVDHNVPQGTGGGEFSS